MLAMSHPAPALSAEEARHALGLRVEISPEAIDKIDWATVRFVA